MPRTRKSRREESLDAHLPGPLASRPAEDDPERLQELDLAIRAE
jgi:hypothetical protein